MLKIQFEIPSQVVLVFSKFPVESLVIISVVFIHSAVQSSLWTLLSYGKYAKY